MNQNEGYFQRIRPSDELEHFDFERFFSRLSKLGYSGNFILQTARAEQGSDVTCIALYLDLACQWIKKYAI